MNFVLVGHGKGVAILVEGDGFLPDRMGELGYHHSRAFIKHEKVWLFPPFGTISPCKRSARAPDGPPVIMPGYK